MQHSVECAVNICDHRYAIYIRWNRVVLRNLETKFWKFNRKQNGSTCVMVFTLHGGSLSKLLSENVFIGCVSDYRRKINRGVRKTNTWIVTLG